MSDIAIRAEGLGKQYRIGARHKYKALRDTLADAISLPFRIGRSFVSSRDIETKENMTIWALKDVSFEIKHGEVVGVIGRNGAGKSTLLKILSRITDPTEGFADLHGRVGSLLEVGTGFHPELTGRENVYLNGSIIGMTKREIDRKFDEIVAFAEIEQFLDTAVKYYSTGMHMRLAFSVAAHLEPEILLVDEVLAVGDGAFQKKCIGKMGSVAKEGRTVVFVSHSMAAIQSLCQRCFLLENGEMVLSDSPDGCIERYLSLSACSQHKASVMFAPSANTVLEMRSAMLICGAMPSTMLLMGDTLGLSIDFVSKVPMCNPRLGYVVRTSEGIPIISANNRYQHAEGYAAPVREGTIHCDLGMVPLAAGRYSIDLYLGDQTGDVHTVESALYFDVQERDIWGNAQVPPARASCLWWPTTFVLHNIHMSYPRLLETSNHSVSPT